MGPDGPDKHRKGKNRISDELASYLNYAYFGNSSSPGIDVTLEMLCTTCFNVETCSMNADTSWNRMDTEDSKPYTLRTAAAHAAARISVLSRMAHLNPDDVIQCDASNDKDEEAILIETAEKRANATAVLNGIFDLLGEQRIEDARNQNILRARTNSALLLVRRLAENILDSGGREVQQEKETTSYTVDEADEFLTGFKDLVISSDYSEQIRLLTLAPSDWGRGKLQSFFNCSQRQARYAVYLRDSGRKLHRPIDVRGNMPFDPLIEKQIFEFYHDDLISQVRNSLYDVFLYEYCNNCRSRRIRKTS
jgi:hypothetical protein